MDQTDDLTDEQIEASLRSAMAGAPRPGRPAPQITPGSPAPSPTPPAAVDLGEYPSGGSAQDQGAWLQHRNEMLRARGVQQKPDQGAYFGEGNQYWTPESLAQSSPLESFAAGMDKYGFDLFPSLTGAPREVKDAIVNAHPWASTLGAGLGAGTSSVLGAVTNPYAVAAVQGAAGPMIDQYRKAGLQGVVENWFSPAISAAENVGMQYLGGKMLGEFAPRALQVGANAAKNLGIHFPSGAMSGASSLADTVNQLTDKFRSVTGNIGATPIKNGIDDLYSYAKRSDPALMAKLEDLGYGSEGFNPVNALRSLGASGMATLRKVVGPERLEALQRGYFSDFFDKNGAVSLQKIHDQHRWQDEDAYRLFMTGPQSPTGEVSSVGHKTAQGLKYVMDNAYDLAHSTMSGAGNLADRAYSAATQGAAVAGNRLASLGKYATGPALGLISHYFGAPLETSLGLTALSEAPVALNAAKKAANLGNRNIGAGARVPEKAVRGAKAVARTSLPQLFNTYVAHPFYQNVTRPAEDWWNAHTYPSWHVNYNQGGRVAYKAGGKVGGHIEPLVQDLMSRYKQARKAETETTKPLLQHHDKTIVKALSIAKKAI